jgi:hypothetical protein
VFIYHHIKTYNSVHFSKHTGLLLHHRVLLQVFHSTFNQNVFACPKSVVQILSTRILVAIDPVFSETSIFKSMDDRGTLLEPVLVFTCVGLGK